MNAPKPPVQFWDLSKPAMCRDFLKQVRIGPNESRITFLTDATGRQMSIDDASDEQILQITNDIASAIGPHKR